MQRGLERSRNNRGPMRPGGDGMRIELNFVDEGVTAKATLLTERAPGVCAMLWAAMEAPFEDLCVHAMFTGRELSFPLGPDRIDGSALLLPPENQIVFPLPGDLVWNGYHPFQWEGNPEPVYDFGIFYGRDSRILLPMGWRPSTHFGCIDENLAAFAEVAARCQLEGRKRLRISRICGPSAGTGL